MDEKHAPELKRPVTFSVESEMEDKKKIAFEDVHSEQEEIELQLRALACGMHHRGTIVRPISNADQGPRQVGKPQQPFWGYRYMTPIEFGDDEPVTSWTIIRTFQDDTGIHGVEHTGRAIGKTSRFEYCDI